MTGREAVSLLVKSENVGGWGWASFKSGEG